MVDPVKHECGVAMLRLLKPLEYYHTHYGSALYGLNKLFLLMEKQHNRGQDGSGIGCIKFDMAPGTRYMTRIRSNSPNPISDIFGRINAKIERTRSSSPDSLQDANWLKHHLDFAGELYLGHLRYGTYGRNGIDYVHPVLRENNWMSKSLMIAGNFNLTNVDELFDSLVNIGQHPSETSDTVTILEKLGHFLDDANEDLYREFKAKGLSKKDISPLIAENLNIKSILQQAGKYWDGGFVVAGLLGHGDSFIMRDPYGIRPAYFYHGPDVVAAASERPAIQTALNVSEDEVLELEPGHALIIKRNGAVSLEQVFGRKPKAACSFERIYFSRGTDSDIYRERKLLGRKLVPAVLNTIEHDLENTVFSYIPNTAASAFKGFVEGIHEFCDQVKNDRILAQSGHLNAEKLRGILALKPRVELIAVKDVALRTFISDENTRDDLAAHVYDVTYGVVRPGTDNLVVVDDSIVRGTTLRQSIILMLDRLKPRKIVIVSSSPQIRYPDCYGIDMSRLDDFIAFRAAIELLKKTGNSGIIHQVYNRCKEQESLPLDKVSNCVKDIYKPFSPKQLSAQISEMLRPPQAKASVEIVFQTIEDLHSACPGHTGDWYFTGNYPTPGGNKVSNRAFINFIEGRKGRSY